MAYPIPTVDTARCTLRLWTAQDIPDLLDLDDDPEVIAYVGPTPPRDQREKDWYELVGREQQRPCLVVRDRETGAFFGWAFLRPFRDDSGDWELGYRYVKATWGRGIGFEVAQALVTWGWQQPQIEVIGAVYETPNIASRAIMLKVGMSDAGARLYFRGEVLPYCMMTRNDGMVTA